MALGSDIYIYQSLLCSFTLFCLWTIVHTDDDLIEGRNRKSLKLRAMKVLIINTTIEESASSRSLGGIDSAITFELYKKYRCNSNPCHLHITANHLWSKYTFIDEKSAYIGTFNSMDRVLEKHPFMGNVLILTHEQWLDKQNPNWRTEPRYKYW